MASDLAHHPLSAAQLANPGVHAAVEGCERAGRPHCREYSGPADQRRSFTKGVDPKAVAVIQLGRLQGGTTLESVCRFTDPTGNTTATLRNPIPVPPGMPPEMALTSTCVMNLQPATREGSWTVEFDINGERASVLRFEVLAGPGARSV